jgi:hypothetical protein
LFGGKNPVLGMLKRSEKTGCLFAKLGGFRETFILRNNLVMFPLDYRKNMSGHEVPAQKAERNDYRYWNSLKTIRLAIENFYLLKAEMIPKDLIF